jgi:two-component system chemotaxis response regulator CheY
MTQRAAEPAARDRTLLAGKRVLVVDDQSYMVDVVCEMVRHFSAEDTVRAESIEAAVARFGPHEAFDCVICDFNMKPINGIQFLQAIRAGKLVHIKRDQHFILLTGHADLDVVKAAKALDVSGYAVKPVAPETFAKTVARALTASISLKPPADYEHVPTQNLRRFQ